LGFLFCLANLILGYSHPYYPSKTDHLFLKGHKPTLSLQPERGGSWLIKKVMAGDFFFSILIGSEAEKKVAHYNLSSGSERIHS
jgi:hypothetical protein